MGKSREGMKNGYKRRNGWYSNKSEFVQQYFHSSVQFAMDGVVWWSVSHSTCTTYAKLVKGISMRVSPNDRAGSFISNGDK